MLAFFTNSDLTILWLVFAVPTIIIFIRYRRKKRKEEVNMGGCLSIALVLSILGAFLIICGVVEQWIRTQPDKMLTRFLKVEDVSAFDNVRSKFTGGLDYTAWVYFETNSERFHKLVSDLNFRSLPDGEPNQGLDFSGFSDAPDLPSSSDSVVYYRESPDNYDIQYIVTNHEHQCGWFVSIDN